MEWLLPEVVLVALLVAWHQFLYKSSRGRMWNPLWMAFSATAAAVFFLASGASGYIIASRGRWLDSSAWTGHTIWWEVAVGIALIAVAGYFWWRASSDTKLPHGGRYDVRAVGRRT
jgi:hypothetical protein